MRGPADYAVVYDISSDRERTKVDKVLKGFGFRIQKSVFECRLPKRGKEELIGKLERLQIKTGFVKLYRVEYVGGAKTIGEAKGNSIDAGNAYVI